MRSRRWTILALLVVTGTFVVQCAPVQPVPSPSVPEGKDAATPEPTVHVQEDSFCRDTAPEYCESHDDCVCIEDDGCFLGNREYFVKCVEDKVHGCPDFCGEMPPAACIDNQCTNRYPRREWDWTFADCENRVPETEIARCQAMVAWSVAKVDLEQALKKCQVLGDYEDRCYLGVAESIAAQDIDQAEELCDKADGNYCYARIAQLVSSLDEDMLEKAIYLCGKIDMQVTKDECYTRMIRDIVEFKSEQYALDFCSTNVRDSLHRDRCFSGIAAATADPSICDQVVDVYQKQSCLSSIYEEIIRRIVESESEERALDFCGTNVKDSFQGDVCFTEIARTSTNASVCDKVVDEESKHICLSYIELNKESGQ